jgi:hypothetical protein
MNTQQLAPSKNGQTHVYFEAALRDYLEGNMLDFLQKADFLKIELQEFYQQLRQGGNRAAKEAALSRLRTAVGEVEAFAEDPGYVWEHLSLAQRWGYLQLVFHVERASCELRQQGSARSYQACR